MPVLTTARRFLLSAVWLTGPILGKELRVSSRRRRSYALRMGYVLVLAAFVAVAWLGVAGGGEGGTGYAISRMSAAGKYIVATVAWVQFIAAQLLAVVMLSTAISEEALSGTLEPLLSTPISGFQLVLGKLVSSMLQILVLLTVSLPVLALVRVFGGVPWSFVLAATCVTFTASMFAGAISLLFSIQLRHVYTVILYTLAAGFLVYVLVSACLAFVLLFASLLVPSIEVVPNLGYVHPFVHLILLTCDFLRPGSVSLRIGVSTVVHCLIMLGLTYLVLANAACVMRRAVTDKGEESPLRSLLGASGTDGSSKTSGSVSPQAESIRPVTGSPLVWMEMHSNAVRHWGYVFIAVTGVLVLAYIVWGILSHFYGGMVESLGVALIAVALAATTVACAASIPIEKAARTWPVVLSTALTDGEILAGKAMGALRCCLPGWLLVFAHVGLCCLVGAIHPIALVHTLLLTCGVMAVLTGLGMYVGTRTRRVSTAAAACLGIVMTAWLLAPWLLASDVSPCALHVTNTVNPVVQMWVVLDGAGGSGGALAYHWTGGEAQTLLETTARIAATSAAHLLLGACLAAAARRRLRQEVF